MAELEIEELSQAIADLGVGDDLPTVARAIGKHITNGRYEDAIGLLNDLEKDALALAGASKALRWNLEAL